MFKLRRKYIDPANQKLFLEFKYNGGSDSITYEYIWGPFAQWLLNFIPTWIAPNLITFSSLLMMSLVHLMFMFVGKNSNGVATWKCVMMAVSIFIYQNMDNLDGKQARKTRTGSPLGMLFDHGVDSLVSFMLTLQFLEIIRVKNFNIIIPVVFIFIMAVFFSALWNQYSTGVFRLGRINPVDEGLPALALTALLFSFVSSEGFDEHHIFAPLNQQILAGMGLILAALIVSMNKDILKNSIREKSDVLEALSLLVLTGFALILVYFLDPTIYYLRNGMQVYYSLLFFWSRNMIEIQLYYVSKQKFKVHNRGTNIFMFTLLGWVFLGKFLTQLGLTAETYFWIVLAMNAAVFFEFALNVLKQGSQLLGINILTIKNKQQ